MKRFIAMPVMISLATTCSPVPDTQSPTAEAWDASNRPHNFDLEVLTYDQIAQPPMQRGSLPQKPWRDSYWPYYKKNIAMRYLQEEDFATLADQTEVARADPANVHLSPAEKYDLITDDPTFALTADSWAIYDRLAARYGAPDSWSWMGICSGWAPASLAEKAPRGHLLVRSAAGREVLLFSGDLRALLSKAHDINATTGGRRTVGLRCDERADTLVTDATGRIVDGRIDDSGVSFTIVADHAESNGALEVKRHDDGTVQWLLGSRSFRRFSGPDRMWLYATRDDVAADLQDGVRGRRALGSNRQPVRFFKGCRDVNPASLHLALAGMLSERAGSKASFVVEMSRAHEVWNHPVWGYRADVGTPRSVTNDPAQVRLFRSPMATHVATVDLRLVYAHGSSPQYEHTGEANDAIEWDHFERFPERYGVLRLKYTLEFDADGMIVGGEWDQELHTASKVPDFLWRTVGALTDRTRAGGVSVLKYSVLQRLTACSRQPADTSRTVVIDGRSVHIDASTCQL